ncbi:DapH/DapD/GlmU-related protein [Erwinia sp. ACCC 02193]|uniref:DapH/DapD/GlmU-related protein n=1 Tax=Erwinia aeris TaxID=3239803 RepID=A0ABV4EC16_9GAMM
MPLYENISITPESTAFKHCSSVAKGVSFSGEPDITLTWVKDKTYHKDYIDLADFSRCISLGEGAYLESLDRVAFHCGRVKLTLVKRNGFEAGKIIIGAGCVLQGTAIIAWQNVTVEDHVTFGPGVTLMDSSGHPLLARGTDDEAARTPVRPVLIKEHSWIGMNAIILPGVTVGRHAVIGAGSVVRTSVPDYAVAAGNPAVVVRYLTEEQRETAG